MRRKPRASNNSGFASASCKRCERLERFFVDMRTGNSIIVGVSPETKMRGCVIVLATAKRSVFWRSQNGRRHKRDGERSEKKIRAIQLWRRPIGASIVRLMREKQAIEIIGAIDRIRQGRGAILAKWPARRTRRGACDFPREAKEVRNKRDVVIHSTSSSA